MAHAGHGHHGAYTEETGSGWVMKGNHFYHSQDYDSALRCYQEALKKEPLKVSSADSPPDLLLLSISPPLPCPFPSLFLLPFPLFPLSPFTFVFY